MTGLPALRMWIHECATAESMEALGARFAESATPPLTIFLRGQLGAGKTTFARGFVHAAGYHGAVRSPTFTLVEPYSGGSYPVYHMDLYRISDPDELELAGIRDYFEETSVRLIEWPERGASLLGRADIVLAIDVVSTGRQVTADAATERGREVVEDIRANCG